MTSLRDGVRREFDELRKKRLAEFMEGFNRITLKLKEMYQMITLGGDAELELVDSLDPFSEGIVFSVRPPKKSWKNISNLSGGEKTLSSLALVFALHHYKPTPLYVMDEIDAALDFRNVSIVAHYIKERTKNAQFIVISLRNNMFELADRLVGIYKTDNCTDSVSINPAELCKQTECIVCSEYKQVHLRSRERLEQNTFPRISFPVLGTNRGNQHQRLHSIVSRVILVENAVMDLHITWTWQFYIMDVRMILSIQTKAIPLLILIGHLSAVQRMVIGIGHSDKRLLDRSSGGLPVTSSKK